MCAIVASFTCSDNEMMSTNVNVDDGVVLTWYDDEGMRETDSGDYMDGGDGVVMDGGLVM